MHKIWSDETWDDYIYRQSQDKRIRIIDGNIEISQGGSHDRDK